MKLALRLALSLAVAGVLVVVLARWGGVGVSEVREALGRLTWGSYVAALGLHVAIYVLRAARMQVLLGRGVAEGFGKQFGVCLAHGMASIVLPAKVGELAYVVYSGRVLGVRAETGLAVVVVARVLDLAVLALGMGVACLVAGGAGAPGWMRGVGLAGLAGAMGLFAVAWHGEWLVRVGVWASRKVRIGRSRLGARLIERVEGVGSALTEAARGGKLWGAIGLSVGAWSCVFGFCAVLAAALGIEGIGFGEAVFGSGVAMLTSLVPVSAFASVGTLEAGWVLGFGVFGVPRDLALATGAGLHVVQLVNVVALGVVGHVVMALSAKGAEGAERKGG